MKKSILFFSFCLVVAFSLNAQSIPAPPTGPTTTVTFDEPVFEFGQITQGEKVQHIYRFTNTGTQPLVISNAKGSCGCTVPSWPKSPVAPGETAAIVAEFNSKGKMGKQTKTITITANTDPPQTMLKIKGEIYQADENVDTRFALGKDGKPAGAPVVPKKDVPQLNLFPNPTNGVLNIDVSDSIGKSANIEIFNSSGQLVNKLEVDNIDGAIQMSVGEFKNGQYWLSLQVADNERVSLPFVVQK
ncbi:MAG: DUF1573 domain-containing protein [Bacteroidota bacterium]